MRPQIGRGAGTLVDRQTPRGRDAAHAAVGRAVRVLLLAVLTCAALVALTALMAPPAQRRAPQGTRHIQGVRSNQLIGYGLVVGLDGTGDQTTQTPFTAQSLQSHAVAARRQAAARRHAAASGTSPRSW